MKILDSYENDRGAIMIENAEDSKRTTLSAVVCIIYIFLFLYLSRNEIIK